MSRNFVTTQVASEIANRSHAASTEIAREVARNVAERNISDQATPIRKIKSLQDKLHSVTAP